MELIKDFRQTFPRLWSVRLAAVASVLSAIEVALPVFSDAMPRGWFAGASFVVTLLAMMARAISQPSLHTEDSAMTQEPVELSKLSVEDMDETGAYAETLAQAKAEQALTNLQQPPAKDQE